MSITIYIDHILPIVVYTIVPIDTCCLTCYFLVLCMVTITLIVVICRIRLKGYYHCYRVIVTDISIYT
jgi:hypothetical protein